jgi:hypothetical protein
MKNKELKYKNYPSLNFVDQDILDFWEINLGGNPDYWDTKEILQVQIIRNLQNEQTTK